MYIGTQQDTWMLLKYLAIDQLQHEEGLLVILDQEAKLTGVGHLELLINMKLVKSHDYVWLDTWYVPMFLKLFLLKK